MRIDPRDYLVLPRIAALTVSMLVATFFYQIISITGGFAVSALLLNVSFGEQMQTYLMHHPNLPDLSPQPVGSGF